MILTAEQSAVIDGISSLEAGKSLKTSAYAGTGKTSTLAFSAEQRPTADILYLVYNRAMASDARDKLPSNTTCLTAHSLAWRSFGRPPNLSNRQLRGEDIANALSLESHIRCGDQTLSAAQTGVAILETLRKFWCSADEDILPHHVWLGPTEQSNAVPDLVLERARLAWREMNDGQIPLEHDAYLKQYQLD